MVEKALPDTTMFSTATLTSSPRILPPFNAFCLAASVMFPQYPKYPCTLFSLKCQFSLSGTLSLDMHFIASLLPSRIYSNITLQSDFYM